MKLQQLQCFVAVFQAGMNVSRAADMLFISQSVVSKNILSFEEELGTALFLRKGKRLLGLSQAGKLVLNYANNVERDIQNIKSLSELFNQPDKGSLNIASTHTQARYFLPSILQRFTKKYPDVELHIHQGSPKNIAEMAANGQVDFAVCTEALADLEELMLIPCYRWNRRVIVQKGHPLTEKALLSLQDIVEYPIITYTHGYTGRARLDQTFRHHGLSPNIAISASDADVVKTYVRYGMGIGVIAQMAYDPKADNDLVAIDIGHLFPMAVTKVGYLKEKVIKPYMFELVRLLSPTTSLIYKQNKIIYHHESGKLPIYSS